MTMYMKAERKRKRNMTKLLEEILEDGNIKEACKRVYANKGTNGIDGIKVEELNDYMEKNWERIKNRNNRKKIQTATSKESRNSKAKWRS